MLIAPSYFWTWVVKEEFLSRKKDIYKYRVAYTNEREPLESTSVYCFKRKKKGITVVFPRLKILWNSLQIPVLKGPLKGFLTESFVEPEG